MIDLTQFFICGLFFIAIWAFFAPNGTMIRWLMAIELLILAGTTELLIAGYNGILPIGTQVIALFWMTFAAMELAIGLAFVRRLSQEGLDLTFSSEHEV